MKVRRGPFLFPKLVLFALLGGWGSQEKPKKAVGSHQRKGTGTQHCAHNLTGVLGLWWTSQLVC